VFGSLLLRCFVLVNIRGEVAQVKANITLKRAVKA